MRNKLLLSALLILGSIFSSFAQNKAEQQKKKELLNQNKEYLSKKNDPTAYYFSKNKELLKDFDEKSLLKTFANKGYSKEKSAELLNGAKKKHIQNKLNNGNSFKTIKNVSDNTLSACDNLGFEMMNFTNWQGYYTTLTAASWNACPNPYALANYTTGLVQGANNSQPNSGAANAGRHTILTDPTAHDAIALDPTTGDSLIPFLAPGGSGVSVRLGNSETGAETEKLIYPITVTAASAQFAYKYAVVYHNPAGHTPDESPFFQVSVRDASGNIVGGSCGAFCFTPDPNDPSFTLLPFSSPYNFDGEDILFKTWTNVGVDLTAYIGQTLTIEFTTGDCALSGHFGYAYIDASCGVQTATISVCPSDTLATLIAPAGYNTYVWVDSLGNTIPASAGGNNDTLIVANPQIGQHWSVLLTSSAGAACVTSLDVYISAYTSVPVTTSVLNLVCNGVTTGSVTAMVDSSLVPGPYNYQWYNSSGAIANSNTPILPTTVADTFWVEVTSAAGCTNLVPDTAIVYSVPDFTMNATPLSTSLCLQQTIQLNSNATGVAGTTFVYDWAPSNDLDSSDITNPIYTANSPGMDTVIVTVLSNYGCLKLDTVYMNISPNIQPDISAISSLSAVCPGDSTQLGVYFNNGVSANCAAAAVNCSSEIAYTVGTGNVTGTTPTPFGGFYEDGRFQMILRASEVNAMGFMGGKISSLSFNVTDQGSTDPYNNFTIKMGCTSLTQYPAVSFITPYTFGSGLTTVYNNAALNVVAGNNTLNFNTDYEWDGTSNILIEFCFDNNDYTFDDEVAKTNVGYNSVVFMRQDGVSGCNMLTANTSSTIRPNVVLGTCGSQPDPLTFTYQWSASPVASISNDTIINPYSTVFVPTTYQVIVTDLTGACADTSTIMVDTTLTTPQIDSVGTYCLNSGIDTLTATPPAGLWSGAGITDSIVGIFDPMLAGGGSHWIYYTKTGNCGGIDSIEVNVIGIPTIVPIGPFCSNDVNLYPLELSDTSYSGSIFTCLNYPSAVVNDSMFAPSGLPGGNYTILYTNSNLVCPYDTAIQSTVISVTQFGTVTAIANSNLVCLGDSVQLGVLFNNFAPACGAAVSNCISETPLTIGTSTADTQDNPTPFLGFWHDGRFQMIITAAELNSAGSTGGKISSLAFDVLQKASTIPYENFTIKMGCSPLTSFAATGADFETGLTTVYTNAAYSTTTGTNLFNFTTDYNWDGSSSLMIEICFDNTAYTGYDAVAKTTTTFNSVINAFQDGAVGCDLSLANGNFITSYTVRPNVVLGICSNQPSPSAFSYLWTPSATLSNDTIINPFATPPSQTTYNVTVSDTALGCTASSTITIDTTTTPPQIIPHANFCLSESSDTLFATIPLGTWSGAGIIDTAAGIFDPFVAGIGSHIITYTKTGNCGGFDTVVVVVDPSAVVGQLPPLCANDNTNHLLTVTPASSGGGIFTCAAAPTAIINVGANYYFNPNGLNPGSYVVLYTDTSLTCPTDTMTVTVVNAPSAVFTPSAAAACVGSINNIFMFGAQPGGTWSISPASASFSNVTGTFTPATATPGTYVITYAFGGTCPDTSSQTIMISPVPVVSITSPVPPVSLCRNDAPVNLVVNATPAGGTGAWTGSPGISGSTFNPATATVGVNNLTYTYTSGGCSSTATLPITVVASPPAPIVTQSSIVCEGSPTGLLTSTGTNVNWYTSSSLVTSVDTGNTYNPLISHPDSFYVTQTVNGCASAATGYSVTFYPNPVAAFSATPTTGDRPLAVNFFNTSSANAITYSWSLGDSTFSQLSNPSYTYENLGEYMVVLTAYTSNGCMDTASIKIIVNDIFEIVVPNVFTPNGDGDNDEFYFKSSSDVVDLECIIFDRWGKKVHTMTSSSDKWSGEGHAAGVYYYTLIAKSKSGKPAKTKDGKELDGAKAYSGYIQLIRD